MDPELEQRRAARAALPVRKLRLGEEDELAAYRDLSPEERVGMMWQLALDAWAMMGQPVVEPRLPRHIVRVHRRGR